MRLNRRDFLGVSARVLGTVALGPLLRTPHAWAEDGRLAGLRGDGVSDDRRALQSLVDAAVAAGGGTIHLPEGTYLLGGQVNVLGDHVTIAGDGPGTVLRMMDGALANQPGRRHALRVEGDDFRLADLTIDGNGDRQPVRLNLDLVQLGQESRNGRDGVYDGPRYRGMTVERCTLLNAVTGQIRVNKCSDVRIEANRLSGVTPATRLSVANVKLRWVEDFLVKDNDCDFGGRPRSSSNNIFITHSGNSRSGSRRGAVVGNVVADSTDSPIEVSSSTSGSHLDAIVSDVLVSGNTVRDGAGIISLQSRDVVIEGNTIVEPGRRGGNAWGIRLGCSEDSGRGAVQRRVVVRNNEIRGFAASDGGRTAAGIVVDACGGRVHGVLLEENAISNLPDLETAGIAIAVPRRNVVLRNNVFQDVARPVRRA